MRRSSRVLEVAGTALVVAGLVGVVRQRRERAHVAAGELAPVHSATRVVTPRRTGPLARRAATWVPQRPSTPRGRALAYAWAAPATAIGAFAALINGGRPRWDDEHGCFVVEGGDGASTRLLKLMGVSANAIGHVVLSRFEHTPPILLAHEAAHVRQAERLGPLLLPLYLWWWGRYGYRAHPLERGAREAARRWARRAS